MTTTNGNIKKASINRDLSIDSLRGLAVVLMVAGHVIGNSSDRGMGVVSDSLWRYSYIGLEDIRMPLFAALSGYVYAIRPVTQRGEFGSLVKGKFRRLLVPLATVGTVFFCAQLVVPGTNSQPDPKNLWRVYLFGFDHLWFVQAMFVIFVVAGVLGTFNALGSLKRSLITTLLSCVIFVFVLIPGEYNIFSLSGAMRLMPFFLIGYVLHRFQDVIRTKAVLLTSGALFLSLYSVRMALVLFGVAHEGHAGRMLELSVGIFAVTCLMLVRERIENRSLAWIGHYSFSIYLLHVFGSAGSRIALKSVGIEEDVLVFFVGIIFGIGLPIFFQRIFGGIGWISWSLLGQRPQVRTKTP